ncbi:dihydrofolate synthase / folylpolyglutamate synthase [Deinococcus reticulitermitis]|uniref:tetrahydrofolate synthase n=1 Tax=Deinococcus reticulitermitis TaxID=856736 RepID=A0A1H7BZK5_9DEIO|nr:folylpolyglutamate synthase/dihydrofolate synthase family protein [Deinococcus reticulitermitis]SEJ82636.1 dihydrofolate synthase / folylpolyglutamate synthase [Deinococcus reticulitermitis]
MNEDRQVRWLFEQQRFGVHPGLVRIAALLSRLGEPQRKLEVLLVGGTNGKGSTAASLDAMLRAGGRRSALFTSPHLTRFGERFVVEGQELPPAEIEAALARLRPQAEAVGASFFEIVTALGLELFAQAGAEIAVMEVGLGGRLDATNALDPRLSVITNVSLDHTAILGNTRELIAAEKAGILRSGRPAVTGVGADLLPILEREGADLWALGREMALETRPLGWEGAEVRLRLPGGELLLRTPLLGEHGAHNAALAAAAAWRLGISPEATVQGAAQVRWPGRLEVVPWQGRRVLLDGAHNPAGAQALARTLGALGAAPLPIIFGAAEDKDLAGVVAPLRPLASRVILTRAQLSPRAAPPGHLAPLWSGTECVQAADGAEALSQLRPEEETVLVCGSLYLLGEVRPLLLGEGAEKRERWQ